jgi:hypothetical protein
MGAVFNQEITSAGGTFTFDPQSWGGGDAMIYLYVSGAVTLVAPVTISLANLPNDGATIRVLWQGGVNAIDINGQAFNIDNVLTAVPQWLLDNPFVGVISRVNGSTTGQLYVDIAYCNGMSGETILLAASVSLDKMEALARGSLVLGNASARPSAFAIGASGRIIVSDGTDPAWVAVSGDITLSSAGVAAIAAGVIVNADINASAAIALSKLAALTASKVVVTDGSGVITTANQVSAALGGTAIDTSASTGFAQVSAGTWIVGAIAETLLLEVSFETGELGDFKIKMPYTGTVTEIYAYATKAIAATDAGTIIAKNNGGTTMTAGTITYAISDPRGTAYTVTPSANNTFVAGDLLTFTTAKATAGGKVQLSIKVTRTT